MKNILFGFMGFVLITFSGCSSFNPSFGITSFGQTEKGTRDTLEGKMIAETFVVIPIGMSLGNDDDMGLKIGRVKQNDKIISYFFRAEVHTSSWIFAEGIRIKIDDQTYQLRDDNPNRKVQSGQYVVEILIFDITPKMLEELRNAKTFTAELYKRVVTIKPEELEKVKEFIQ